MAKATSKQAKTKESTQKKSDSESNEGTKAVIYGRLKYRLWLPVMIKLTLVLFVLLAFYALYLDAQVQNKFEGQRWQVPVQVYGKVESFQQGDGLVLTRLAKSLTLTGYQRVNKISRAGHFALSKQRLIVYRRAFDFGDGISDAEVVTINVKQQKVTSVFLGNQKVSQIQLEPLLIDRIVPESKEDRVLVALQSVPEALLDTLLLVEDRDFYFHAGISPLGILRALYSNLRAGRTVQGGSTLTQQLVKNMYLTRDKTLWRKLNEAIMALLLEYRYSKDQLLEAYINEVYLGQHYANGIYGFGLAAEFYFGKNVAQLNFAQMATLIGVIKGPSYYDPWRYSERTKKRRDLILKLMFQKEYLSKAEFIHAVESPLSVRKSRRLNQNKGKYPAYLQLVKRELAKQLSPQDQSSGIRVFTNFSVYSQQLLEQTVKEQLIKLSKKEQHHLQAAMMVTEIKTGAIKALVGGKESGYAGFNRALNAKRPIGSLIKPAIYLAALERYQQFQLASILEDKAVSFTADNGEEWRPKNYDKKYRGQVPLIDALVYSLNIPTINLGMSLGLENVADAFHLLGYPDDIVLRPSMLLGSLNMSPYQVNQFYLPIANQGQYVDGHVLEKVISAHGETLWQHEPTQLAYFSEQASYLLDYALSQVTKIGTAKSLTWRLKGKDLAGKTGTTNEQRDSWFVGYDDKHLITTWLGRDDNKPTDFTGSSGALVLFADFMSKQGVKSKKLQKPTGVEITSFEQVTGEATKENCPSNKAYPAIIDGLTYRYSCSATENKKSKEKLSWFEKIFGN